MGRLADRLRSACYVRLTCRLKHKAVEVNCSKNQATTI